jgi:hypothetical protein
MTDPSAPLALTAHLALVSSISFGGFPTVLPDVHNFVVGTHGWMTDQDFANIFAIAQSIPGPNMILMMSFIGWKVWGFPGAVASAFATFGPPGNLLCLLPVMGPVPGRTMAADRPSRLGSGDHGARHCQRHGHGAHSRHQLAGRRRHDRRSRDRAGDPAQSDVDACDWRSSRGPRRSLTHRVAHSLAIGIPTSAAFD